VKKRTFLLLEVLIAFVLVTICSIPLVKQPLKLYKDEMEYLEKMERERLADWTFTEIREMLLKNEIPWKKIPAKGVETAPFPLSPMVIEIPGCKTKVIERSFVLKGRGQKIGLNDAEFRQIGVYIFLNDHKYEFRIPVQKLVE
jgi:hypothetical protein